MRDRYRLEHPDIAARFVQNFETDLVDGFHVGRRAAIHDRRFRTIDLNHRIVDAKAAQSCQHVLGGGHQRTRCIPQYGRKFGGRHRVDVGAKLALAPAWKAGTNEANSAAGVRRVQRQRHR